MIDGESYRNIGIRAKGNTSLSTVASLGSERYSFKIEFDQYDSSITYHGLDKLSLNNLIQDSTMMKDYLTYTMMNEFDVAAPLCSYVYITVNGKDWGLYLAVEGVEDSFLERNYGSGYGELYKPDSMNFGGGRENGKDFDLDGTKKNKQLTDDSSQSHAGMPDKEEFEPYKMLGNGISGSLQQEEDTEMVGDSDSDSFRPLKDFDPSEMFGGDGFDLGSSSEVKLQYMTTIWRVIPISGKALRPQLPKATRSEWLNHLKSYQTKKISSLSWTSNRYSVTLLCITMSAMTIATLA